MIRGRLKTPTKDERSFWDEYSGLLLDDTEVPWNDLITELRSIAIIYWAERDNL